MLRHKNIDRICCIVLALTLLLTCCFMGAAAAGVVKGDNTIGYENRLFDQSRVHTIDIVMDDWEAFLETCTSEVYSSCTVIIDGESYGNAAIRGKGNTSLSSVAQYGNNRYSFKIEFDQYQSGRTYHGLDKLSLNNVIQDKTYLKDYVAYTLMNKMGVAAPLCSFAQIRVNGEDWGFYLAVEGVEDGFLQRNYGSDHGELYKPDSMSFGGGRGNGKGFDMENFAEMFNSKTSDGADEEQGDADNTADPENADAVASATMQMPGGFDPAGMGDMPGGFDPSGMGDMFGGFDPSNMTMPENFDFSGMEMPDGMPVPDGTEQADSASSDKPSFGGMGGFGMGSSDVKLQYIDDDPESYTNIFNNAKTDATDADKDRLIASLKTLSEGENIESVVDVEAVIRYFVVHNYLCNDDSYTGQMIHNYYLYEEDGVMAMIPWDYNLAFGGFSMGGFGGSGATSTVNTPIDSLVSGGDIASRPMAAWIFEDETYTAMYHEIYAQFIAEIFDSGWFETEISRVIEMIAPYVQADENGFFSYVEFQSGASALKEFCALRAQSIAGQLAGTIPSTTEAQRSETAGLIDASHIDLSDMGEFGMGGGMGRGGFSRQNRNAGQMPADAETSGAQNAMPEADADDGQEQTTERSVTNSMQGQMSSGFDPGAMQGQMPGGFDPSAMQGQTPAGFDPGAMQGQTSGGFDPSAMQGQMSSGFDPSAMQGQMPGGFDPGAMQGQTPSGFDPSAMQNQTPEMTGASQNSAAEKPEGSESAAADELRAVQTGETDMSGAEAEQDAEKPVQIDAEAPTDAAAAEPTGEVEKFAADDSQRDRTNRQMAGFPGDFSGMSGNSQVSAENQWAMLIGSAILLIAAIVFAKFFKSNL